MARVEWGWPLGDNPLSLIRMPKNNPLENAALEVANMRLLGTQLANRSHGISGQ